VVLFGPSGAGKTLTLQAIAGLVRPQAGVVRVGDRVLFDSSRGIDLPARERKVGYLFQDYALFPHCTVEQNVAIGLGRWWRPRLSAEQRAAVSGVLETLGLQDLASSYPAALSGGQRQRVALARALVREPDVLLLDEPFAALDRPLRARMRENLRSLQRDFGVPVVLITHDPEDVEALADTLVVFEQGAVRKVWPFRSICQRRKVAQFVRSHLAGAFPG
jgi:molybdate transport system ATP-binding protein